jgi:hypothetical protein
VIDPDLLLTVIDASDRRRDARRQFLRSAGAASLAVGGGAILSACGATNNNSEITPTPTATTTATPSPASTDVLKDQDTFNFALNLEYLEAQFYSFAVTGAGLPAALLTGTGVQGGVTGGRAVTFTDPVVQQYAREIAADEVAHVAFLRSVLGASAVAQPAINIDGGANGAFTVVARAAGLVTGTGTFDPYASDENFLLAAFIFEDVGVTAYKGASPLIAQSLLIDAAAGILAAEAYHAGLIRTVLYGKGIATPSLRTSANAISDARDSLDGTASDLDEGIGDGTTANLVPTDPNGITFSRTPGQVLNVVYLNRNAVVGGGFFPAGVNGTIKTSAAS